MPDDNMPSQKSSSLNVLHDVLGIKAVGEIGLVVTKATVEGASAFLSSICMPAAEEFGEWMKDEVHLLRKRSINAVRLADRARRLVEQAPQGEVHAPPRLVAQIIETGSWSEEEELQQMWGGLLASACSPDGKDDSNLIFTDLLSRMTIAETRLINFLCSNAIVGLSHEGLVMATKMTMAGGLLIEIMDLPDIHDVDRELDHLRELGLIQEGFGRGTGVANVTPSALALNMFMRCSGFRGNLIEFRKVPH